MVEKTKGDVKAYETATVMLVHVKRHANVHPRIFG